MQSQYCQYGKQLINTASKRTGLKGVSGPAQFVPAMSNFSFHLTYYHLAYLLKKITILSFTKMREKSQNTINQKGVIQ